MLKWFARWFFLPLEEESLQARLIIGAVYRATSTRWWKPANEMFVDSKFLRS